MTLFRVLSGMLALMFLTLGPLGCTPAEPPAPSPAAAKPATAPTTAGSVGVGGASASPTVAATRAAAPPIAQATASPTRMATPSPTVVRAGGTLFERNTMFTVYGVAFDTAPILGILGQYKDFDHMARESEKYVKAIDANNGDKGVITAIHLIYGMAIPCDPGDDCLLYTEGRDIDLVKEYIEPAAKRGWHVILDTQLGMSDPVTQVKRMIDKGYLKYENVHVALDPEFRARPGQKLPGIPIGTVDASEINAVQKMVDEHAAANGLRSRKMVMVHQFGDPNVNDGVPFMIGNKKTLDTSFKNVDLVIDADGFGGPDSKINKYNLMTDAEVYPMLKYRAIKIFYPNRWEQAGHHDTPPMEYDVVFGHKESPGGTRMKWMPDVIVIA
ncbi:MAG: hypothetical protein HY329_15015 [Chloroflexi bacterium]|nr:hypothetical protein [Chloroflexota bacterium]